MNAISNKLVHGLVAHGLTFNFASFGELTLRK